MDRTLLAVLVVLAGPAMAQQGPGYPQVQGPAVPPGSPPAQAAAAQQIANLQSQLRITADQAGPWEAFVQVMRENARATDAQFGQRYSRMQSLDAASNLEAYAQVTRAYAEGNERIAVAFRRLYGVLRLDQRQAADALFRQAPQERQQ